MLPQLSVVILTYNEEKNLQFALESVRDLTKYIFVLDSYSTDGTAAIAHRFGVKFIQNKFTSYSDQRNFALKSLEIETEWVLFLDADEWLMPELKSEIEKLLGSETQVEGYFIKRRVYFMNQWIKHGYYPVWLLRLFRKDKVVCESRIVNEHFKVQGKVGFLENDFVDENHNGLDRWLEKQIRYASLEAKIQLDEQRQVRLAKMGSFSDPTERKRWVMIYLWPKVPSFLKPFLYFSYRYFLRLGFLDGRAGFAFHFLQGFWMQFLIELKKSELRATAGRRVRKAA